MIETEGIVLNELKIKESSKILKVYSRQLGLISIYAKGALRKSSPFTASSQIFSHNSYRLKKQGNFFYIQKAIIISLNYDLRKDYESFIYGSMIVELYEKSNFESEINKKTFDLLAKYLKVLPDSKNKKAITTAFFLKYISFMGFRPSMVGNYFSIENGGMVNENDVSLDSYLIKEEEKEYLKFLLYSDLSGEYEKNLSDDFLFEIVLKYIKYNLEIKDFNSLKLL